MLELINNFKNNVSGYETNSGKISVFLYTSNKQSEEEIKKRIPLDSIKIKYIGVNLTKEMQVLYTENYKTLLK